MVCKDGEAQADNEIFPLYLKAARPEPGPRRRPPDGLDLIFRRHRRHVRARRTRVAALALALLVLIPVLVQTNVISAVLDLIELKGSETVGRIFRTRDGSLKFNVLGDRTDEEIQEYGQMLLADEGVVTGGSGFIIQDEPFWLVTRTYQAFGKNQDVGTRSRDPACELTDSYLEFITRDWRIYRLLIEDGTLKPVGSELVELDGIPFRMQVWELHHPEFGTIKYYAGGIAEE